MSKIRSAQKKLLEIRRKRQERKWKVIKRQRPRKAASKATYRRKRLARKRKVGKRQVLEKAARKAMDKRGYRETEQETKCLRKLLEKQWRKGTR